MHNVPPKLLEYLMKDKTLWVEPTDATRENYRRPTLDDRRYKLVNGVTAGGGRPLSALRRMRLKLGGGGGGGGGH